MKWNSYVKRRRFNEQDWLRSRGIADQTGFIAALNELGIEIPADEELTKMFPAPVITVKEEINESSDEPSKRIDKVATRGVDGEGDRTGIRPSGKVSSKLRN